MHADKLFPLRPERERCKMKISRIDVFQLDIPLEKPKRYPKRTYG